MTTKATVLTPLQSLVTFRNSQGEPARGTLLKIERGIVVFEVYNPYSIVQLSEVLRDLTITRGGVAAYKGRAVVSNLVNTGLMLIVSATLVDSWIEPEDDPGSVAQFQERTRRFVASWEATHDLRPQFRVAVTRLRSFFADLNAWLEQALPRNLGTERSQSDESALFASLADVLIEKMRDLIADFLNEAAAVPAEAVAAHRAYTKAELHPFIMRAPFPYRTYHKPLGYAGDYAMMNMIHNDAPEGPNIYAQLINRLYTRQPMALSVRNRVAALEEHIHREARRALSQGRRFRMISVGCGPAAECERFILKSELAEACTIDLVDFNEQTLSYARSRLSEAMRQVNRRVAVNYIQNSVHHLLKQAASGDSELPPEGYDLAYCAGLFDYLSDRVCARLTKAFASWLRPGGMAVVTNMHSNNVDQYIIEYMFDWFLIYRDEARMDRFYDGPGTKRLAVDATGVNLSLEIRKPERDERGDR